MINIRKILVLFFVSLSLFANNYTFKELPIQEDGRIKPLDSYARNQLLRFYGKSTLKLEDQSRQYATDWLKYVLVKSEESIKISMFNIRNPEVAYSFGLERTDNHKYSFVEIVNGLKENQELLESLKNKNDNELTLVEKQIIEVYQNVIFFDEISHSMYCFLPLITVNDVMLCKYMEINPGDRVSYSFFMRNIEKFKVLLQNLLDTKEDDWNDSHVELSQIALQLQSLTQYHYSQKLKIIPPFNNDENQHWLSPWELMDGRPLNNYQKSLLISYEQLILSMFDNDIEKENKNSNEIISKIKNYYPAFGNHLLIKETSYNKMNLFLISLIMYVISFLLIGINWMSSMAIFRKISLISVIIGFASHAYGLILRIIIMQRPPVSTLYESIIFVSFILVLFALIFEFMQKDTIGILIAVIGGSLLHFVGLKYAAEGDTLGMLVAVLNSNFWLAIHVTTITIGYGVSLVAGLMGHIYLVFSYFKPKSKNELIKIFNNAYGLTLMGLFFTLFGTILGGIWADQSWGRFWGWDPKENGALLIVLWHLMVIHLRVSGMVKPIGYAFAISLVNIVVAIAWFGVNLLNVGLHSYGFTDNVATNLFTFILVEIIFTSTFYYLAKNKTALKLKK